MSYFLIILYELHKLLNETDTVSQSINIPFIIVTSVVGVMVVIGFILLFCYLRKQGEIERKIKESSKYIKILDAINYKYSFENISKTYKYRKDLYDWRLYRNFDPDVYLTRILIDAADEFIELVTKFNNENDKYKKYLAEYDNVKSNVDLKTVDEIGTTYTRYQEYERRYYINHKKTHVTKVKFKVYWFYHNANKKANRADKKVYSFAQALNLFYSCYHLNDDINELDLEYNQLVYEDRIKKERALLNDSLRYDIMRRDGFRCVLCGVSAKEGAKLHVDHIIPVSRGGRTIPSNLRTLCDRCNLGKSNKLE